MFYELIFLLSVAELSIIVLCRCPIPCVCVESIIHFEVDCSYRNLTNRQLETMTFPDRHPYAVLNLTGNLLTHFPTEFNLDDYSSVYLDGNRIQSLSFVSSLLGSSLGGISLNNNLLQGNLSLSNLSSFQNITYLSLRNNNIKYIDKNAFSKMFLLRELDISGNKIEEIDINAFTNTPQLDVLNITDNPLVCNCFWKGITDEITTVFGHCFDNGVGGNLFLKPTTAKIMDINFIENNGCRKFATHIVNGATLSSEYFCFNGGVCYANLNIESYHCRCRFGFDGDFCENFNLCKEPNPCQNNGTCQEVSNPGAAYKCVCRAGFRGDCCEEKTTKEIQHETTNNNTKHIAKDETGVKESTRTASIVPKFNNRSVINSSDSKKYNKIISNNGQDIGDYKEVNQILIVVMAIFLSLIILIFVITLYWRKRRKGENEIVQEEDNVLLLRDHMARPQQQISVFILYRHGCEVLRVFAKLYADSPLSWD